MSILLSELEAHPFRPELVPAGPYLKYLSCLSDFAPGMSKSFKKRVRDPKAWPKLAKELAKSDKLNSFLATTQAIDIINGGVKVNALPEVVDGEFRTPKSRAEDQRPSTTAYPCESHLVSLRRMLNDSSP